MKTAFLAPYFGHIPSYFPYWAASCEPNQKHFHWFVYSDQIQSEQSVNPAVTLIPYQFSDMVSDFDNVLRFKISGRHIRKVCDYRIVFYFIRRNKEPLDQFDFIGYTDLDMIYGELKSYFPENMEQYAVISGDDHAPCGPLTAIQRRYIQNAAPSQKIKAIMETTQYSGFDESPDLLTIIAENQPVWCRTDPLQPAVAAKFHHRKTFAVWDQGKVTVWDVKGNKRSGGFYHFSRYKNKKRFKMDPKGFSFHRWGVCKFGFIHLRSKRDYLPLFFSLLI